jgi:GMP synthase-like glutamine amidotransferase
VQLFRLVRIRRTPSFEVCYSMQLFSLVHGGKVVRNPLGKEVGFNEIQLTR